MKQYAFILFLVAGCLGAEPNCQQQVGQRGMEEAADRIGQKIEVVGNKFDPLLVELTRLVRVSADLIERSSSPPAGLTSPHTPTGAGGPATPSAPTLPWWLSGEFVTAVGGVVSLVLGKLWLAHQKNARNIETNKESLSGKVSKVPARESVAKRSK